MPSFAYVPWHSAHCTHAECTLHARFVHTARTHCEYLPSAQGHSQHTSDTDTKHARCAHRTRALCTLHCHLAGPLYLLILFWPYLETHSLGHLFWPTSWSPPGSENKSHSSWGAWRPWSFISFWCFRSSCLPSRRANLCWPVHTVASSVSIGLGFRNAAFLDRGRKPCGTSQGGGVLFEKRQGFIDCSR